MTTTACHVGPVENVRGPRDVCEGQELTCGPLRAPRSGEAVDGWLGHYCIAAVGRQRGSGDLGVRCPDVLPGRSPSPERCPGGQLSVDL
jgi:hypothetical protein